MSTRKEQFRRRNDNYSAYEHFLYANATAMSMMPWTQAFAWMPVLQAELSKPFKYKGITNWSQRDIGVTSKQGITASAESSGLKYGADVANANTDLYIGGTERDESKSDFQRVNELFTLSGKIATAGAGAASAVSGAISAASSAGSAASTAASAAGSAGTAATEAGSAVSAAGTAATTATEAGSGAATAVSTGSKFKNFIGGLFKGKSDSGTMVTEAFAKTPYWKGVESEIGGVAMEDVQKAIKIISEAQKAKKEVQGAIDDVRGYIKDYRDENNYDENPYNDIMNKYKNKYKKKHAGPSFYT